MKKRLFVTIQYLEIGGAERSLLGMLNAIDYSQWDVDLFVYEHRGEFMQFIPKEVHLLPEISAYAAINRPMTTILRQGHLQVLLARLLAKIQFARYRKNIKVKDSYAIFQYVADCVTPVLPSLKKFGKYDVAISYLTPHNIVRDKVLADKKYAWIHTDYNTVAVNTQKELPVWSSYDRIMAVSEDVRTSFITSFPSLADKVCVFENILSPAFVREQAQLEDVSSEMPRHEGELIFCSVGRFTYQKNFESAPQICRLLKEKGLRFRWYLIGYGPDEALIKENAAKEGVEDLCIVLGKKSNPYPYMAACDIYLQPSRYEGKAVTVREAQMLYKPVVISRFPTSAAQVEENIDGVIVPLDNEGFAEGLFLFAKDEKKRAEIADYLQQHDFGNEKEIEKLSD